MSGEFRWVTSSYFHSALAEAAECGGDAERHAISRAMTKLYAALAPIERGCARYEACDSGPSTPTLALIRQIAAVRSAMDELTTLARDAEDLIDAGMREREKTEQQ